MTHGAPTAVTDIMKEVSDWNHFLFFLLASLNDSWSDICTTTDLTPDFAALLASLDAAFAIAASPFTAKQP